MIDSTVTFASLMEKGLFTVQLYKDCDWHDVGPTLVSYALPCDVRPGYYAMAGTDTGYAATRLRSIRVYHARWRGVGSYRASGRILRYLPTRAVHVPLSGDRLSYAMSGTDLAYASVCYAMSGTDIA
eukprot:916934-Rhodomonas_salina.1